MRRRGMNVLNTRVRRKSTRWWLSARHITFLRRVSLATSHHDSLSAVITDVVPPHDALSPSCILVAISALDALPVVLSACGWERTQSSSPSLVWLRDDDT
jgi:hypothetical protein